MMGSESGEFYNQHSETLVARNIILLHSLVESYFKYRIYLIDYSEVLP